MTVVVVVPGWASGHCRGGGAADVVIGGDCR